jgi:hypothetical protein
MKQKVIRKVLSGSNFNAFTFKGKSRFYLVKNFSGGDLLVTFDTTADDSECFKIKSGMAESVAINSGGIEKYEYFTDTIYIKGSGEVEVQQLD